MSLPPSLDPDASCGSEVIRLNRLLRTKGTTIEALAEAARVLCDSPSHLYAVPLLLRLSRHRSALVRKGAVTGMRAHPVLAVGRRLSEMEQDKDASVRGEVEKTEQAIEAIPILCANGCEAPATLRASSSGDPNDPTDLEIFPVFCGTTCAAEWALDRFREELRAGGRHACIVEQEWMAGSAKECPTCEAADLLDEKTG